MGKFAFYAVASGKQQGIFTNLDEVVYFTSGIQNSQYKGFNDKSLAQQYINKWNSMTKEEKQVEYQKKRAYERSIKMEDKENYERPIVKKKKPNTQVFNNYEDDEDDCQMYIKCESMSCTQPRMKTPVKKFCCKLEHTDQLAITKMEYESYHEKPQQTATGEDDLTIQEIFTLIDENEKQSQKTNFFSQKSKNSAKKNKSDKKQPIVSELDFRNYKQDQQQNNEEIQTKLADILAQINDYKQIKFDKENQEKINTELSKKINEMEIQIKEFYQLSQCQICLNNIKNCVLECGHRFCLECATDLQKKTKKCPICRRPFKKFIKSFE